MQEFYIKQVTWATHEAQLRLIREQVFILEQQVPVALEWDAQDKDAWHLMALNHPANQLEAAIGCARVLSNGSIGRMAVLQEKRGIGIGKALLNAAVKLCKQQQLKEATLSAQTYATSFYEKAGFVIESDGYLDANIPHVDMLLKF
jgi:predicted GNAT family N-acyltransferase